jgi:hypothetical protein
MLRALCLADAGPRKEEETLLRLARLSPEDYRLARKDEARLLGVRLCTLDREVRQKRRKLMGADFKRAFVSSQEVNTYTSPTGIAGLRELRQFLPVSDGLFIDSLLEKHCRGLWAAVKVLGTHIKREAHYDFPLYDSSYFTSDPKRAGYLWLNKTPCCGKYEAMGGVMFHRGYYSNLPETWVLMWVWIHPIHRNRGVLTNSWGHFMRKHAPLFIQPPVSDGLKRFLSRRKSAQIATVEKDGSSPMECTVYVAERDHG